MLDVRHVSIQLSNDLDYSRVFAYRSFYILNCQMMLLKWTPFFDVKEESPIVPVWISFPNLRLHFFNANVLHALGSIFGRPLQTDQAMTSRSRPSVARILVEIDITKKHSKEIWIGSENTGYLQKVDFENIPIFVFIVKFMGMRLLIALWFIPNLETMVRFPKVGKLLFLPSKNCIIVLK
ncbi:hypothetical protein KFK09_000523 [Dendrobium nobile]|uniref:DUF4283 domain-containing protein n=1 Tax=Dendrobium nobile TaxID=94219 RepID=A0A8T3C8T0_DENNO|nr:hypothetical protein KFK09_000523 [Dendrobium nobile]